MRRQLALRHLIQCTEMRQAPGRSSSVAIIRWMLRYFPANTALRVCCIGLAASLSMAADPVVKCPVTADTWVYVPPSEAPDPLRTPGVENHGTDTTLEIRGRESLALFQFDISGLKGRKVSKALLRVHRENADPVPLHTVGISTISGTAAWAEGAQKGGAAAPGESNYFFARAGQQPWSYTGSDVVDVTFGQGGSLYSYERARDTGGGWYEVNIPAEVVAALVSGDQFGIMLTDEKGQTQTVHRIDSRESRYPPVLVVTTSVAAAAAPGRVRGLKIESTPEGARGIGRTTLRPGSVILKFGGAGGGKQVVAHYDLRYSDRPITAANFDQARPAARWMLNPLAPKPNVFATSNGLQDWAVAVVEQLTPAQPYYFAARAVDAAGNAGPVSPLGKFLAYARTFPALPMTAAETARPPAPAVASSGAIKVWAVPELLKIRPRTGELMEQEYTDHRSHNSVWDASTGTVRLRGARNEFLGFQLAIESASPFSGAEVNVSRPLFESSKLPPVFEKTGAVQLAREWFVSDGNKTASNREWYPDALVPLGPLAIPSKDNPVPGQTVVPVFVDVYVPHDAAPGRHSGELLVRAPGFEKRIRIQVEVLPLTLPDKLDFIVDLNCYSGVPTPAGMRRGTPEYRALVRAYHRVAHLHRTNLDILGYSQTGTTEPDQAPPLAGEGASTRVASWQDWDAHFGPILDGSAFKDLPRSGVPVPAVYMPFFENWPGDLRKGYTFDIPEATRTTEEYTQLVTRHALTAGPIEETFRRDYQDRFSAVMSEFARHIKERGWLDTTYLVYFNNKYYFKNPNPETQAQGSSMWLLDEPNHRDDSRALSFFTYLTKRGLEKYPGVPIQLRTDISRVDWVRDILAGQIDIDCVSGRLFNKNRYLMDDRTRFGRTFWNYASTNHPRDTNVAMRAWCWRAWVAGADAVVPWNAADGRRAWERAEQLTVFYPGDKIGQLEPLPSLRLKAYRRGQQDVEYLVMLARKKGWDREAVQRAVSKNLDLSGGIRQSYDEDAGDITLRHVNDDQMDALRLRVAQALTN